MKLIAVVAIVLLLTGCGHICPHPPPQEIVDQEQIDFVAAFDVFQMSHKLAGLQQFIDVYPGSEWSRRARTIVLYSIELDRRKGEVVSLRKLTDQQEDSLAEIKGLNQQLALQLEQFKNLLIQTEAHQVVD